MNNLTTKEIKLKTILLKADVPIDNTGIFVIYQEKSDGRLTAVDYIEIADADDLKNEPKEGGEDV